MANLQNTIYDAPTMKNYTTEIVSGDYVNVILHKREKNLQIECVSTCSAVSSSYCTESVYILKLSFLI